MNIEVVSPAIPSGRVLKGEVAIVAGSTSGIGLRIARASSASGALAEINSFGAPGAISDTLAGLQDGTGARAIYSAANMTKPSEIADMVRTALETFGRRDILINNPVIQHVSPIDQFPLRNGTLSCHRSVLGVPHHSFRIAGDAQAQWRADHQHRLRAWPRRLALQGSLCYNQARRSRPDQGGGA